MNIAYARENLIGKLYMYTEPEIDGKTTPSAPTLIHSLTHTLHTYIYAEIWNLHKPKTV